MSAFEVFTERRYTGRAAPQVSLQKGGRFSLNKGAYAALGQPGAVEFLYSPDAQTMGIRAVGADVAHGYPVRPHNRGSAYLVSGLRFLTHYGIDHSVTRQYVATWDADARMLRVVVNRPG